MPSPRLETWFCRSRNRIEAPELFAGHSIVSVHKPAHATVAPRHPDNHLAVNGQRRKRGTDLGILLVPAVLRVPEQRPCLGMERQQMRIATHEKHALAQHCNAAVPIMPLRL